MQIIVDSRERLPLEFYCPSFITDVLVEKLNVGDYACRFKDGHQPNIVFERKSIPDLFSSVGGGDYKRFKKEITRAHENGITMFIIVEGQLMDVFRGYKQSQVKGRTMVYKLFTLWIKHGVQTIFCKDRREMSQYITQFYIACGKQHLRKKGNGET